MTSRVPSPADTAELRSERDTLLSRVSALTAEIDALNEELTETNNGVVALYAELDDRAEQLRHASELKSRFLSYMSHEFRTPLGSIESLSRILLDRMDGPLNEEQERQVGFMRDAATAYAALALTAAP